jgi:two-component system OmpR family response regulator
MRILLIEDDTDVRAYTKRGLMEQGYVVDEANNGKEGLFLATTEPYDMLLLDRMLPELDGLTLLKTLRGAGNHVPIILLSALGDVDDRVEGLKAGGDDYLVKPFAFTELLARIDVLTRRSRAETPTASNQITVGDLTLNLMARRVTCKGRALDIQPREFRLLAYLMQHAGAVVTRTMLLENVWDYHFDPQTNVIDVHVSRLRRKLEQAGGATTIRTVRGAGYAIEAQG